MKRGLLFVALCSTACVGPTGDGDPNDEPECGPGGVPSLEVAQGALEFGAVIDGVDIVYGRPPQGGAPYAPFRLRMAGMAYEDDAIEVVMLATEVGTDVELGTGSFDQRFICSNVGESEGYLVGSELHMRFPGWSLDDLRDRSANVVVTVTDALGTEMTFEYQGHLVMDGDDTGLQ